MKKYKNYLISLGISFLIIITLALLNTIFSSFNILPSGIFTVLKVIIPIIAMFISGIFIGSKTDEKGYLEGLKIGIIYVILIFIFTLFFSKIKLINFLNYIIIILSSSIGSMICINKKKED